MALLVHINGTILGGNDSQACTKFKEYLNSFFQIKDLGPLKYFLGIEVAKGLFDLFLCQCEYALEIVDECLLLGK